MAESKVLYRILYKRPKENYENVQSGQLTYRRDSSWTYLENKAKIRVLLVPPACSATILRRLNWVAASVMWSYLSRRIPNRCREYGHTEHEKSCTFCVRKQCYKNRCHANREKYDCHRTRWTGQQLRNLYIFVLFHDALGM